MRGIGNTGHSPSCRFGLGRSVAGRGSSGFGTPPQHGINLWPCSSGSTSLAGSRPASCTKDNERGSSSSTVSSMSRPHCQKSPARFVFAGRGLSQPAFRLRVTRHAGQCRKECVMSLAGVQKSDGRNVVDSCRCKFRHRAGSKPEVLVRR
jgi:hypothetical protein